VPIFPAGLLTSFVTDMLAANIQPLLHNLLQSIFLPSISPFQQPPLLLPVASHVLTGFILSPLDLIRTRLIIQSFLPRHRTYSGPIDAFFQILQHEGGVKGMYLHPHLLIPGLLDNTLRPLVSHAMPGLLTFYLGSYITEDTNPVTWGFAELVGSCAGLLITLPFETVRRRLQAQVRGSARPLKACVELRPAPYNGVVDTMWHILTEERSDLPVGRVGRKKGKGKTKEKETEGWYRNTGLGQLYRGLGMRLGASVIVFLLGVLTGGEERESGWAEL
jgi:mitochondrial fusion and transport protein UGO1